MVVIFTDKELPARQEYDVYITPIEFCRAAIRMFPLHFRPQTVLDPGAGTGQWGKAVREYWPKAHITGIELRDLPKPEGYDEWIIDDFTTCEVDERYHLVVGNPPFKATILKQFIFKSLMLMQDSFTFYGQLGFLLGANMLFGTTRARDLWTPYPAFEVAVSPRRINFEGLGDQQPRNMAFYMWKNGYQGESGLTWMDWNYDKD